MSVDPARITLEADGLRRHAGLHRVSVFGIAGAFGVTMFWLFLVVLPALFAISTLFQSRDSGVLGFDFMGTIWRPLHIALHGGDPYPTPQRVAVDIGNPSVYPPISFLLAAPLAVLPYAAAATLWAIVSIAGVVGGLFMLGVRDLRCYGVALTCFPVAIGLAFGNLSLLLVPLLAATWVLRRRVLLCGVAAGAAIALKLFLLPILVWLVATRRFRAAAVGLGSAGCFVLVPWLALGLQGAANYPRLLRIDAEIFEPQSKSVTGLALALGASSTAATVFALTAAGFAAAVAIQLGRHGDDGGAFAMGVAASLLASPIVWEHYYAILLAPAAVLSQRFTRVWAVIVPIWLITVFVPGTKPAPCCGPAQVPEALWRSVHGTAPTWQIVAYLVVLGLFVAVVVSGRTHRRALPSVQLTS